MAGAMGCWMERRPNASRPHRTTGARGTAALLLTLAALLLTACDTAGPAGPPATEVVALHRGNTGELSSLDPQRISGVWESHIARDLFLGLLTDAADGSPIPGVAERYTVSDDGMTYRFVLRQNHTWSDGVPVTAEDFVFAYRRILTPETAGPYASLLHVLKNGRAVNQGAVPPELLGARAEGPGVLILDLEHPAPYLPQLLTHYAAYPVPRHVVGPLGEAWSNGESFVSNGAYRLGSWRPGEPLRLEKNAAFFDASEVSIERVVYYPTRDGSAALSRFLAGELDVNNDFPIQQLEMLRRTRPGEARIAALLKTNCIFLNTRAAPFDNQRLRNALALAIDRTVLARDMMRSGQIPAYAFVPPGMTGYPGTAALAFRDWPMETRIMEAQRLMADAGYSRETPLQITLKHRDGQDHRNVATALSAMWRQIYVETTLVGQDIQTHYNDLRAGDYEVADGGWVADYSDAGNYLFLFESTTGELNYTGYASADYDRLITSASETADPLERNRLLAEAEQVLLDQVPVIPTFIDTSRNLVGSHVTGWVDNPENKHPSRFLAIDESIRRRPMMPSEPASEPQPSPVPTDGDS